MSNVEKKKGQKNCEVKISKVSGATVIYELNSKRESTQFIIFLSRDDTNSQRRFIQIVFPEFPGI